MSSNDGENRFTFSEVEPYLISINDEFETYASNSKSVDEAVLSSLNNGFSAAVTSPDLGTFLKSMWENNTAALYDFKDNYNNWCVALTEVMIQNGINDEETINTYSKKSLDMKSSYRSKNDATDTKSTDFEAVADANTVMRQYSIDVTGNDLEKARQAFMENYNKLDTKAQDVIRETARNQIEEAVRKAKRQGLGLIPTGGNPIYTKMAQQYNDGVLNAVTHGAHRPVLLTK